MSNYSFFFFSLLFFSSAGSSFLCSSFNFFKTEEFFCSYEYGVLICRWGSIDHSEQLQTDHMAGNFRKRRPPNTQRRRIPSLRRRTNGGWNTGKMVRQNLAETGLSFRPIYRSRVLSNRRLRWPPPLQRNRRRPAGDGGGDDIWNFKIINALLRRESGGRIQRSGDHGSDWRRRWVWGGGVCGGSEPNLPVVAGGEKKGKSGGL